MAAIFAPMVTSVAGIRYPVAEIGALARPEDALFIVDAAQAVGQGPVAVGALGCDALVATTRKWVRGPRETGLYWLNGRASAVTGLHAAPCDMNVALRLGQGVAMRRVMPPSPALTGYLRATMREMGLVPLAQDTGAVTLRIGHDHAPALRAGLEAAGVLVKWPDPVADEPESGVTLAEGALLRLSPHAYNTTGDVDHVVTVIRTVLS